MGFEIRHSQVLCAPQYASALANAMRQLGLDDLDGLLVSYCTLACGFAHFFTLGTEQRLT